MGDGEVSSLPVCESLHSRNISKAVGGHIIQEPKPNNAHVTKNPDKNFSLQFHCVIHTRSDK